MRKAALHNLGCKVNAYETEAMTQLLKEAGYEIVPFEETADVYVINTCSVTNIADRKSRQMLHRAKKRNPGAVVAAVGCYAQVAAEKLQTDDAVDLIIGNNRKKDLVRLLEEYFDQRESEGSGAQDGGSQNTHVIDIAKTREYENLSVRDAAGHTRAFIKIQDGCNQFCAYCVIPYARGRVRSRSAEEIRREAEALTAEGYQELVLTGIHISSYGIDQPEGERVDLVGLLEMLDKVKGLRRLRLGSLEPRIVTEDFVRRIASLRTVCPHFHLSLQSGCDATLRRMNRHYTTQEYEESCRLLRRYFDRPAITTDVIAGFPGETEEEFGETEAFLKRIGFYELHVFPYSKREGTRAAGMPDQVEEAVKKERAARLLRLDQEASAAYRQSLLGEEREVLLEEKVTINGIEYLTGYTREYVKAAVAWQNGLQGNIVSGRLFQMIGPELVLLLDTCAQRSE